MDDRVRTAGGTAAPRFEPAVRTAPGFIETVLDGAPLVNRTADGAYVVAAERASLTLTTVPRGAVRPPAKVLKTAYEAGYYELPCATATEAVAAELELHPSTVAEHLHRAERNLLAHHIGEP